MAESGRGRVVTKKKVTPKLQLSENVSDVFCLRFSPDSQLLAAGCGDGAIRIYNAQTGRLSYNLNLASGGTAYPTTCIRFRPVTGAYKTRNVFLAANADGTVQHWHVTSGKKLHTITEEGNQVFAVDYRSDGTRFATAGKDFKVRIYDESTKQLVSTMNGADRDGGSHGHANRVFSVKFFPDDENILMSAGWDNTVQFFDTRTDNTVRSIFGPHICGDAVDVNHNVIVTGSWRPDNPLQLWDFGSCSLIETVPWTLGLNEEPCFLYCAQFSKEGDGELIAAGGSGSNEAKVFDRASGRSIGTISGMTKGVYTLDFSPDNNLLAVAGGDASIRLLEIKKTTQAEGVEQ